MILPKDKKGPHNDVEIGAPANSTPLPKEAIEPEKTQNPPQQAVPNFSLGRRILITAVLCLMTLALTYSSSAYASSLNNLKAHFQASTEVVLLGISLFVLGFAVGPLIFGPLAFLIGDKPVYIATYAAFTGFAFGASEAPSMRTLIVMRFFMGVFGSSSLNNVPATLSRMVPPISNGRYVIWYAVSAFGGPGLGPVLASFIDHRAGFRWNLRVQAIFIAATTLACILVVPEIGIPVLKQKEESNNNGQSRRSFLIVTVKRALLGPFVWFLTEPVVTTICVYLSLLYGILYGFFEVIPFTFTGVRHWSEESTGLIYISLLIGFMLAFPVMGILQAKYEAKIRADLPPGAQIPPEAKVQQMLWAGTLPPIGLFIFAWTAPFTHVHWIGAAFGMATFGLGMMIIFTSLIPYLALYAGPSEAPLALAAGTFTRATFGCSFPLFTLQMYRALTVQGATSLLAGVSMLLVPMPWILKRYGAALRAKSKRAK